MTTESTDGDEQPTCSAPTDTTGDPCQRPVSTPDDRCYIHADDGGVPDDHGAPDGNQNAVGNDGGAPVGNTRATEHGLNMSVKRRLEWFKELPGDELSEFEDLYVHYYGKCENPSQAAALASLAVIRNRLERHLLLEGVFYEDKVADPDELIEQGLSRDEAMERAFVDKPKTATVEAYTDACREIRLGLDYEGATGDSSGGGALPDGVSAMWED